MANEPDPLFRRLLGAARFDELPKLLRCVHDGRKSKEFRGRCEITAGRGWAARALARVTALPKPGRDIPVNVTITCEHDHETWVRRFADRPMQTRLSERTGQLVESLGPIDLAFSLVVVEESIVWNIVGARAMGFQLPLSWFTKVTAKEAIDAGRYTFDARAELPYVGLLVHYRGWLESCG